MQFRAVDFTVAPGIQVAAAPGIQLRAARVPISAKEPRSQCPKSAKESVPECDLHVKSDGEGVKILDELEVLILNAIGVVILTG